MKSILIVGFGSIGQRHCKNFKSLGCDVSVVSRRSLQLEFPAYANLIEAFTKKNFDIVFICTETSDHQKALDELLKLNFKNQIIVEKPLFDLAEIQTATYSKLNIHVSYNLRFHPMLQKLKSELKSEKILSSHIYVGQYLPTWRPTVDYRNTYSAKAERGGGVLLDLSHELDFSMWLFGKPLGLFCRGGQWSDLEINSMDTCGLIVEFEKCPMATIQLNYTDRMTQRFLIVNTNRSTYKIDFIQKQFWKDNQQVTLPEISNDTYIEMCRNILDQNSNELTTFKEAILLTQMMSESMLSVQNKTWSQL